MNDFKVNITGGGSIFLRGKKLWIKYKSKRISTGLNFSTENIKICEKKLKEIKLKEFLNIKEDQEIFILEAWKIFETKHLYNKAPATLTIYNYSKNKIIIRDFIFTQDEIEKAVFNFIKNDEISLNSKKIVLRHFSVFLNFSYANNLLQKKINLMRLFPLKTINKKVLTFSEIEITKILEYWRKKDKEFSLMIELMLYSGLRIGETLNLEWKNINFAEKIIHLENKITKSYEELQLTSKIENILNQLPKRVNGKIFRWSISTKSRLNRKFNDCFEILGIERKDRSFHNLRKTFLKKLYKADVVLQNASKIMRHSDINTTLKYYTEFENEELRKEMEKI